MNLNVIEGCDSNCSMLTAKRIMLDGLQEKNSRNIRSLLLIDGYIIYILRPTFVLQLGSLFIDPKFQTQLNQIG